MSALLAILVADGAIGSYGAGMPDDEAALTRLIERRRAGRRDHLLAARGESTDASGAAGRLAAERAPSRD